jgi:hypothetical protein
MEKEAPNEMEMAAKAPEERKAQKKDAQAAFSLIVLVYCNYNIDKSIQIFIMNFKHQVLTKILKRDKNEPDRHMDREIPPR